MSRGSALPDFAGKRRLKMIRQSEAAECGLACLAMIADFHGHRADLGTFRLRHPVSLKGSTLKSLIDAAQDLGLRARAVRAELDSLARLQAPCILHWNMNHFVVLKAVRRNGFLIHDPARGARCCSRPEMSSSFTGIALELRPGAEFRRGDERVRMRVTDLCDRITGIGRALTHTLVLSAIIQLFVLASPFYLQLVVDEVLTGVDTELLLVLALGFGLFVLVNVAATALRSYVILYTGNMLGFQLVSNLFRHLMCLPLGWYDKRHVGDILSRFSSTRPLQAMLTEGLVATLIDGLMALTTLGMIFIYNVRLGVVVMAALVLYLALRLALYRPLQRRTEDLIAARAEEQSTFIESIRGIQSIRLFGSESLRHSVWQNRYAGVINGNVNVGKLTIGFDTANGLLFGLENTVVVYLGALAVVDGAMTVGMLFAFMAYKRHFVEKTTLLVERVIEFRLLGLHLERIADIGVAEPEVPDGRHASIAIFDNACAGGDGAIDIRDLSFRYSPQESWIIRRASLSIRSGEMLALVGVSGAGKTTLLKLLLGLLCGERGYIAYGGRRLTAGDFRAFRSRIGTVMQGDTLLAGSIADNIAFFDTDANPERIRACAERASIHADIAAMPMGYDSLIGDMADTLSAGQRQRVLLARALYREPEILVLDEGTANLDVSTERAIIEMLRSLGITRICVAHRRALIEAADRVVMLKGGRLYEPQRRRALPATS